VGHTPLPECSFFIGRADRPGQPCVVASVRATLRKVRGERIFAAGVSMSCGASGSGGLSNSGKKKGHPLRIALFYNYN